MDRDLKIVLRNATLFIVLSLLIQRDHNFIYKGFMYRNVIESNYPNYERYESLEDNVRKSGYSEVEVRALDEIQFYNYNFKKAIRGVTIYNDEDTQRRDLIEKLYEEAGKKYNILAFLFSWLVYSLVMYPIGILLWRIRKAWDKRKAKPPGQQS